MDFSAPEAAAPASAGPRAVGVPVNIRHGCHAMSAARKPTATAITAISRAIARGFIIVAAVGNDGPAAPPLYPASYPNVVGVTAVDVHDHVLIEAARGPQVMFASPGADLAAANGAHGYAAMRGTSFAAPIVAGLLAAAITTPGLADANAAIEALAHTAKHIGSPGRDLTYGYGLVGAEYRNDPTPLLTK